MQEYSILPKGKSVAITPALPALWCWGNTFLEVPCADADVCSTPISHAKCQIKFDDRWEGEKQCLACQKISFGEKNAWQVLESFPNLSASFCMWERQGSAVCPHIIMKNRSLFIDLSKGCLPSISSHPDAEKILVWIWFFMYSTKQCHLSWGHTQGMGVHCSGVCS